MPQRYPGPLPASGYFPLTVPLRGIRRHTSAYTSFDELILRTAAPWLGRNLRRSMERRDLVQSAR